MRVLHLVKTSVGAAWAWRQMRELMRLGVEVHVALPPGGPMVERYADAGVRVWPARFDLPSAAPSRWPALLRELRRLVDRVRPDLVHSHFVGTTIAARLALGRRHPLPRLFQIPGPLHLEHAPYRRLELATAGPADRWIGSCEHTCRLLAKAGVASDRIFLAYYGTDVDRFDARRRGRLRAELALADDQPLVGMVAFLYAPKRMLGQRRGLKGHEDFVDALVECFRKNDRLRAVSVGGAWDGAEAYERRVRRYGADRCGDRLAFLGTRDDVAELYPDLDVAVHPSHSENVGGAVESLLSGVPTIATRVGGFPDLVRPGWTGWLVAPRRPAELADAILEALADPREAAERARRGRALARELFDVRQSAATVHRIYSEILGRRGAG